MGLLGTMSVNFTGNTTGLVSAVGGAKNALASLASNPMAAVGLGIAAVGAVAIKFGSDSVKAAADFQQSMLKVQAYAGLSKQQTDSLGNSILQMAASMGQSPKAMADALYPIISSGYSASQALTILQLSAKTSAASGANMAVVADALTTSLKAMHAPASQAANYTDMLNKMVSIGKGEVPQYAAVIGKLALSAGSAKVPFADMGAALATLTTHGFPSVAQASTALGNLFTQIGPKVDSVAAHAKKLGLTFDENAFKSMSLSDKLNYLNKITGGNQGEILKLVGGNTLALKSFNALEGSTKDFTDNLTAMQHAAGTTNQVYSTASGGMNAANNRLSATMDVLKVKVGNALLPMQTAAINASQKLVAGFIAWEDKTHGVENAISALQTVMAKIGGVIGGVVTGFSNIVKFFQNNQVAAAALLIPLGMISAILVQMAVTAIVAFIAAIPGILAGFGAWALAAGAAAIATIAATWPILLIGAIVGLVIAGIILAVKNWGAISKWLTDVWHNVQGWFASFWNEIKKLFFDALAWLQNLIHTIGNWIYVHFIEPYQLIWAWIKAFFAMMQVGFHYDLAIIQSILQKAGQFIYNIFIKPFKDAWDFITGIMGNIGNLIKNTLANIGNVGSTIAHNLHIPGFSTGVHNFVGGLSVVGEQGPELLELPSGSNVYPNGTVPSGINRSSVTSNNNTNGGQQEIYVMMDSNTLAHVTASQQAKIVKIRMNRRAA